ncbi:MAG: hypothetical protein QM737_07225 [Ferruginibacter sp.]
MNLNFFNSAHSLFPMRWLITGVMLTAGTLFYYDYSGNRLFDFSEQEQWSKSGPGYHK